VKSGRLAAVLNVSASTLRGYRAAGVLTPARVTPGGQALWDVDEALATFSRVQPADESAAWEDHAAAAAVGSPVSAFADVTAAAMPPSTELFGRSAAPLAFTDAGRRLPLVCQSDEDPPLRYTPADRGHVIVLDDVR